MTNRRVRGAGTPRAAWLLVGLAVLAWWAWQRMPPALHPVAAPGPSATTPASTDDATGAQSRDDGLPLQADATARHILQGGPFVHRQDGAVFQNREHLLPTQPRGYYREYTVETPGSPDRGARRIIAGGDPPVALYYSDDHYRSFRRVSVPAP